MLVRIILATVFYRAALQLKFKSFNELTPVYTALKCNRNKFDFS